MKEKKLDRNLQELFRHKLNGYEAEPGPSVGSKLMRKLEAREFIRFNPGRFNIWYLGALAVAAAFTAVFLFAVHARQVPASRTDKPIIDTIDRTAGVIDIEAVSSIRAPQKNPEEKMATSITGKNDKPVAAVRTDKVTGKQNGRSTERISLGEVTVPIDKPLVNTAVRPTLRGAESKNEKIFEVSSITGCAPLKVEFRKLFGEADSCFWSFGDGGSSRAENPEWIYDIEGEYRVVLKAYGHGSTLKESSRVISVYAKPQARFEIAPRDPDRNETPVIFRNFSSDAVSYLWSFGDGTVSEEFEPSHRYQRTGSYNVSLRVVSDAGCVDSLTVFNAFSGSSFFIEFPNAFIPNTGGPSGGLYSTTSDESAQVFHPSFNGVTGYTLRIFSKIGVLVFESNDINIGWDGYFKGQLCNPGVYIWKVRGNYSNGEPFTRMGDVTLIGK